jgi:hypothetical protein
MDLAKTSARYSLTGIKYKHTSKQANKNREHVKFKLDFHYQAVTPEEVELLRLHLTLLQALRESHLAALASSFPTKTSSTCHHHHMGHTHPVSNQASRCKALLTNVAPFSALFVREQRTSWRFLHGTFVAQSRWDQKCTFGQASSHAIPPRA